MLSRISFGLFLLLGWTQVPAFGQLLLRVSQANQIAPVANGGAVTVTSQGVGQATPITISITYIGTGTSLNFRGVPELLGSKEFTFLETPPPNAALGPGQTLNVRINYTPTSSRVTSADFSWGFNENFPEGTSSRPGVVVIGLNGITPEFKVAYSFAIDGNVIQLPETGGNIQFIPTPINTTTVASIVVVNRGSGPGEIQSVSVSGDAFSLVSVPLLPATLAAGGTSTFQLRYRPRTAAPDTGTLTITLAGGITQTFTLSGSGISSYFTYELLPPDAPAQPIVPNQAVVLPSVDVGQRSTSFIRFRNDSQFDITAASIAVTGEAFTIADVPFLPLTVAPGDSHLFSVTFAPTRAGRQTGRLRVGNDTFELVGDAVGSILTYTYRTAAGTTTVQPLEPIVFPAVAAGETSVVDFTVRNTGSAPAPISNIGISSSNQSVFTLANLPPLPSSIPAGGSITFQIRFRPITGGTVNASLLVNGVSFPLIATSNQVTTLPDYTINGPATVQAFDQPRVSLTLAQPYAATLRGTLNLIPEADNSFADPAVQFSSGGRTASFVIPAGTTSALFFNGSPEIRFQAGSAAGSFFISATFSTEGGVNVTPEVPKTLRITLPPSAPRILTAFVTITTTGLTIEVSGVATTRSISRARVSFKGKPGFNIPTTDFTLETSGASLLWFQSSGSSGFGGQFSAQLPFVLTSSQSGTGTPSPSAGIESVTVTLENQQGTSNAVTVLMN